MAGRKGLQAASAAIIALFLAGCVQSSQSRYNYDEVGRTSVVHFGTVIGVRNIDITGRNTGAGALVGGAGGAIAGTNVGHGSGTAGAMLGAAVAGAIIGGVAEQAMSNRTGLEYTVVLENGKTITLAQEQGKEDRVFAIGERVMVQASGRYQRVLATDHIPTEINRPKGITIKDAP